MVGRPAQCSWALPRGAPLGETKPSMYRTRKLLGGSFPQKLAPQVKHLFKTVARTEHDPLTTFISILVLVQDLNNILFNVNLELVSL
jgi:hypothetical protein